MPSFENKIIPQVFLLYHRQKWIFCLVAGKRSTLWNFVERTVNELKEKAVEPELATPYLCTNGKHVTDVMGSVTLPLLQFK